MKKIIAFLLALAVLSSFCAITVSAENHFYEDFSESDALDDASTWVRVANQCPEKYTLTVEDGYFRFRKNVSAENPAPSDQKRFENKLCYPATTDARVWMFDFYEPEDNGNSVMNGQWFFTPGWRIWYNVGQGRIRFGSGSDIAEYKYTKGQWYSVMLMISKDYTKAEVYAKPQGGSEWTRFSTESAPSIVTGNVNYFNYVSLYENSYTNRYLDIRLDNIRFYSGDNLVSEGFELDSETVEDLAYVAEGNLSVNGTLLREEAPTVQKTATSVMVAFDENDMMLDFKFNPSVKVTGGVTNLSAVLDTTEYFDKIAYVGYYLWDEDLQPYFDGLELN